MSDHCMGTQIQISLNSILQCVDNFIIFYSYKKESHIARHFGNALLETSGSQDAAN